MRFTLLTVFPEMLGLLADQGVVGRAARDGLIDLDAVDLRDFAVDRHGSVDDRPYGGGAGMVLRPEPLLAAIDEARRRHGPSASPPPRTIALSPSGERLTQRTVSALARESGLILLCGRYEGFDQRVLDTAVDQELSIGDYVLSGGELPALVLVDAVARLLPGVLGNTASPVQESHLDARLDFPQYTRPENHVSGMVPKVLLSGDHAAIDRWRRGQALLATYRNRPDLLTSQPLGDEDRELLRSLLDNLLGSSNS